MTQNSPVPSREEVLHQLAEASLPGGLGLFVGTGFSIAATEGSANPALTWGDLLERASEELDLAFPPPGSRGMSYPRMASELVRTLRARIEADSPELDSRTTLLVGYGLGDLNVLTPITWARSYSSSPSRANGRSGDPATLPLRARVPADLRARPSASGFFRARAEPSPSRRRNSDPPPLDPR